MALESIAIVGGGIGGLAAAILLAEQGYAITVFDKAKTPCPVGAGFLLQPPGQAVLDRLGALHQIEKQALPIWGLQSQTLQGHKLLDLDYRRLPGTLRHGLGVQRSNIYEALLGQVLKQPNIQFVWDAKVEQCINSEKQVTLVANDTASRFDLCLLCAGANSDLASAHFKKQIRRPYGWGCFWATIKLPSSLSANILHQRCQSCRKMMGVLPVSKVDSTHHAALYWSAKSTEIQAMNHDKFADLKREIITFWPDVEAAVQPLQYQDITPANYRDIWTPKPYTGRIIALGDASHATSPQLGQGCTMALLDAYWLAKSLERSARCDSMGDLGTGLDNRLEYWWRNRYKQLAYVRYLSRWLTPLFQSDSKFCSLFRDKLMAPVGRLPVFEHWQLKTLASEVFLPVD